MTLASIHIVDRSATAYGAGALPGWVKNPGAALRATPKALLADWSYTGLLFENMALRDVRVYISRDHFTVNPTSCEKSQVVSILTGSGSKPRSRKRPSSGSSPSCQANTRDSRSI